ncbi:hypothetical protein KC19_2G259300 [Ceratodon purpureus]|uniref:Methyltransferase domain-containing protein n=1 Tax=Ceratodon purpureus TaxID=3225 RepID=A0A8T0J0K1_CERPU|nr:hypothetical protein KC19_2G259300 [Ceratodon purpureus]
MGLSMYSAGGGVSDLKIHVSAIATFLRRHEWLWRAHVVDFFHIKLWERVDEHWNSFLRVASVETLLLLPSGVVQEEWPDSLKEFVQTAFQLSLSRRQVDSSSIMSYSGVPQAPISSVLGQGMSIKKLHEIGILAALIAGTAKSRGAKDVIDVGAGQGYLALVLAFEYRLSVIAVDACAHHADVTNKRALRIQKYYNARSRKAQQEGLKYPEARGPHTVTCRVGTGESPAALSSLLPAIQESNSSGAIVAKETIADCDEKSVSELNDCGVVLAGLHACGDLSATMLRTFIECKEVAAVINVGCCYNLLSDDETSNDRRELHGFPMSDTVEKLGLQLGRSARDLACQSADRWKDHHPTRATQNFELHAFRAAFQLVLERYYPETAANSPSIGRAGKSRRRRQARQSAMEPLSDNTSNDAFQDDLSDVTCITATSTQTSQHNSQTCASSSILTLDKPSRPDQEDTPPTPDSELDSSEHQAARFEEYARLALERLHLLPLPPSLLRSAWREVSPDQDLVAPFYSLRAVLAPVIESYILLDRLLYLKEQAELVTGKERISAELVPLFDPAISPRNMAIIAHRSSSLEN